MPQRERINESARRAMVKMRIESEKASRFNIGTRWEVVASSPESPWQGAYAVTLKEIEAGGEGDLKFSNRTFHAQRQTE